MATAEEAVAPLVRLQAAIRDRQRDRFDAIHNGLHALQRTAFGDELDGRPWSAQVLAVIEDLHETTHLVMREFERAIIIHGRLAVLEGRDPKEVTRALYPTRTVPEPPGGP